MRKALEQLEKAVDKISQKMVDLNIKAVGNNFLYYLILPFYSIRAYLIKRRFIRERAKENIEYALERGLDEELLIKINNDAYALAQT